MEQIWNFFCILRTAIAKQNYRIKAYILKDILSLCLNSRETASVNLNQWMYLSI